MISESSRHQPKLFTWLAVVPGALAVCASALHTSASLDVRLLLLTLVTLSLGTRIVVKIPRTGGYVPVSEAFVFLALLVFDGEAAVPLAAVAAFCAALRFNRELSVPLAGAALAAASTLVSAWALRFSFGPPAGLTGGQDPSALALAALVLAFVPAAVGSFALAAADARRGGSPSPQPFLVGVVGNFVWALPTYFAVASAAVVAARLAALFGLYPLLAAAAVAAVAHFAYCIHLKHVHAAEGAEAAPRTALPESPETFRGAFEHAAIGMALVSAKGRWLTVNRSLCELLGYDEGELAGRSFQEVTYADDLGAALANVKRLLKGEFPTCQMEKRYVNKQGTPVWVLWDVARVADPVNDRVRLVFQVQDITERKRSEARLLHDAFHDALTGLPNRALFIDHVQLTIARAKRREGRLFAVLFLDLDRFKIINDSLGHMVGDQLLVGIARRLESCLREGDTVARVGGDEFTVLLEDIVDETEAVSIAERIQKELSTPFNLSGHEVFSTVSIGIAPSSGAYDDPEDILRDADTAMYRAKSLGKARYEVFDKAMHAFAVNLLQLETDLRRALDRKEFFMLYQPIVALDDFHLCGFEALVRWQHPERGLISPMDFIPVAEDTGQIIAIGQWALFEACRQMRRWQKQFPAETPLFISVNLSTKQFAQPDLIEQVRAILEKTRLDPRSLKLEITESAVMENIDKTTEMLAQLRGLGVQLSIDDFGTGYSSLSYLHRFPIDTLKIDRSFVTRMVDNSENIEIVRTIVMLAQVLGMDVVAEGVETKEQLALLRKLNCENGQGYYFSKPTSVTGAEKIIADTCARPQSASAANVRQMPLSDDKVRMVKPVSAA